MSDPQGCLNCGERHLGVVLGDCGGPYGCAHNVISVRVWWRARWVCVRCNWVFREVPTLTRSGCV